MAGGGKGSSFLRQLSSNKGGSRRWSDGVRRRQMDAGMMNQSYAGESGVVMKKRVVVVIDHSSKAKHAMMWALTHVANKGDLLTLLHVVSPQQREDLPHLAQSLGSLCKASRPEVEVEALVIQGPKLQTVLSQVKKLEASVLVLSHKDPSPFCCLFGSSQEDFVEQCINNADCLTLAVRKQSGGLGGYLVSTRWQKNFWLLA